MSDCHSCYNGYTDYIFVCVQCMLLVAYIWTLRITNSEYEYLVLMAPSELNGLITDLPCNTTQLYIYISRAYVATGWCCYCNFFVHCKRLINSLIYSIRSVELYSIYHWTFSSWPIYIDCTHFCLFVHLFCVCVGMGITALYRQYLVICCCL